MDAKAKLAEQTASPAVVQAPGRAPRPVGGRTRNRGEAELAAIQTRSRRTVRTPKGPGDAGPHAPPARPGGTAALRAAEEKRLKAAQALAASEASGARARPQAIQAAEKQCLAAKAAVEAATKALAAGGTATPRSAPSTRDEHGRRRALAEWITARDNPLAAQGRRQPHLARPLRPPARRDGLRLRPQRKRPSHPELLDWLAVELMESGWSMKHSTG